MNVTTEELLALLGRKEAELFITRRSLSSAVTELEMAREKIRVLESTAESADGNKETN